MIDVDEMSLRSLREAHRPSFARWLLGQRPREGFVGELVAAAKKDPSFPKDGDPEAVRKRLRAVMAEGDMFQAVDDAELEWSS
jgi:hypothetical protein